MLFREEEEELLLLRDREEAGQLLAAKLSAYVGKPGVLVLGLPRGGVVVAFEIAKALKAPLDVFVVRKLGVPGNPELAMGAVASGGVRVLNTQTIQAFCISGEEVEAELTRQGGEVARQEQLYRKRRPHLHVTSRTIVLVDDGVATGATIKAGIAALRQLKAAHISVAVPVTPLSIYYELKEMADEVVCITAPKEFYAISQWYETFEQVSDDEVVNLLRAAVPKAA